MLTRFFIAVAMTLAALAVQPARANVLSDSWSCAKNAGMTAGSVGVDLYKKGEALAANTGPLAVCLAKTGPEGQVLVATSSALTALRLAKPSLLPKGQCEARIKGVATKPFVNGLAPLIPASSMKNQLVAAANSDTANQIVWSQIGQLPPPFSSVPNQIECGCLISDSGLTLTDISEITNAVSKTSASCGKMLDSLGLGFINDIGSYAGKLAKSLAYGVSDKWDEVIGGQSDPSPPGSVFEAFYGRNLDILARGMAKDPSNWQQTTKLFNNGGEGCNYNMNSGGWEGQCNPTLAQMTALCVNYYDNHKMSKSNAQKVCSSYQDAVVGAASVKSKQFAALAALPSLAIKRLTYGMKDEWVWRMPRLYSPGVSDFNNGNVSGYPIFDPVGASLRVAWSDVLGSGSTVPDSPDMGQPYKAKGVLETARSTVLALGNDPQKAIDLAFAAAQDPLRDKARKIWASSRKGAGMFQLREWYPTPTFGFRYGCPATLDVACGAAMEARYDQVCFTPVSEAYITSVTELAMVAKLAEIKKSCMASLANVLAAATKLENGEAAAIAGLCPTTGTRDEMATCNENLSKTYRGCAAFALKQGKDSVGQCMAARQFGNQLLQQIQKGFTLPGQEPATRPPAPAPQTRCDPNGVARCPQ